MTVTLDSKVEAFVAAPRKLFINGQWSDAASGKTFDNMFATSNAGTDVVVQQPESVNTDWGDTRERVPASVVDTASQVDGVAVAAGSLYTRSSAVLGTSIGMSPITATKGPCCVRLVSGGEIIEEEHPA